MIHAGIFIYPLDGSSVVVGFEAMIGNQIITVQVKDKTKIDDCYFDSCNANGTLQSGGGKIVCLFIMLIKDFTC